MLASCTWGLLHALRAFGRRPSPAWMLSTHRYLSALALTFHEVLPGPEGEALNQVLMHCAKLARTTFYPRTVALPPA